MLIDFRYLFPKYGVKPKGVLHVGANVSEERDVYLELGIKHQVWIEANPNLFEQLVLNTAGNPYSFAFNICAGDENRKAILHEANNSGQSSSVLDLKTHKTAHPEVDYIGDIEVDMYRLDYWFEDKQFLSLNMDLLNIDVQGFELNVLKGMGDLLRQFKWAYLEVNKDELYEGCAMVWQIDEYLLNFGFERVETLWCGNTGWGDAFYVRK